MPNFDYICIECGEKFRVKFEVVEDKSKVLCPKCGAKGAERIVYAQDRSGDSCCTRSYG
jgi:putative FmdB family regulatory protein